jgi:hypothetical protein
LVGGCQAWWRCGLRRCLAIVCFAIVGGSAAPTAAAEGTESAAQQLEQVMQDPLFSRWEKRQARAEVGGETGEVAGALEDYGERLGGWIERLFEWLFERDRNPPPSPAGGGGEGWGVGDFGDWMQAFGWTLGGVTLLLLLWIIWALVRNRAPAVARAEPTRAALEDAMDQADALAAESGVWSRHARELAEQQDLRRAFRAMYLSLLSGLHQAGRIRYRPQRTNRWFVRGYRGPGEERGSFATLTERFDRVWYGQQMPDPDLFHQVRGQVETLLRQSESPPAEVTAGEGGGQ